MQEYKENELEGDILTHFSLEWHQKGDIDKFLEVAERKIYDLDIKIQG